MHSVGSKGLKKKSYFNKASSSPIMKLIAVHAKNLRRRIQLQEHLQMVKQKLGVLNCRPLPYYTHNHISGVRSLYYSAGYSTPLY